GRRGAGGRGSPAPRRGSRHRAEFLAGCGAYGAVRPRGGPLVSSRRNRRVSSRREARCAFGHRDAHRGSHRHGAARRVRVLGKPAGAGAGRPRRAARGRAHPQRSAAGPCSPPGGYFRVRRRSASHSPRHGGPEGVHAGRAAGGAPRRRAAGRAPPGRFAFSRGLTAAAAPAAAAGSRRPRPDHILPPYAGCGGNGPARRRAATGVASLLDGCPLALLGGDQREVELMRALAAGGARLRVVGLPTDGVPAERLSDPAAAVEMARAVIAPMSGADGQGRLPTPLDPDTRIRLDGRLLSAIGPKRPLFIGALPPALAAAAAARGVRVVELASVDEIAVANSVPTAEGAVRLAMERLPVTIHGSKALVLGFGRCGTTLARLLDAMGADVGVVA